jgi:hypothetical protein
MYNNTMSEFEKIQSDNIELKVSFESKDIEIN